VKMLLDLHHNEPLRSTVGRQGALQDCSSALLSLVQYTAFINNVHVVLVWYY